MNNPRSKQPVLYGHGHIGTATQVREYEDRHYAGIIRTRTGIEMALAIVADGVGGSNLGQRAAQLTVDTIVESCMASDSLDIPQILGQAIGTANRKVYAEAQAYRDRNQMSATASVAAIVDGRLFVANVGDSRVYLVRGKHVIQVTLDHTWAQERVREGKLRPEEAERHPNAHMITRSVGYQQNVQVDLGLYFKGGKEGGRKAYQQQGLLLDKDDMILVCSDGLVKPIRHGQGFYVHPGEISEILGRSSPERAAKALVDLAVSRNADDNVTAVVLEMPGRSRPGMRLPNLQIAAPAIAILSITLCILAVAGILIIPAVWPGQELVPTPQPGYASIFEGQVTVQQLGGEFMRLGEGEQIQFGPGTILRQESGEAALSLPGGFLMRVAGNVERPTLVEFYQAAGVSGATETVLILRDGSLFVYTSETLEEGQRVQVETAAGRAYVSGTTMGARFDNNTWLFEVDCVIGTCLLTTNLPAELPLSGGLRSFVDSSGIPNGPFPVNLDLYKDSYNLEAFIDEGLIADITATYRPPVEDTPTPNPTPTPTLTPTPTQTPLATWTFTASPPAGQPTSTKPPAVTNTIAPTFPSIGTNTPNPTATVAPTEPIVPTETKPSEETDVPVETTEPVETIAPTQAPSNTPKPTKLQITLDITLPAPFDTPSSAQSMDDMADARAGSSSLAINPTEAFLASGLVIFIIFGLVWMYFKKSRQ